MHPAPSVILFTVLSGMGFGMLAWLGLGVLDATGWNAFGYFFVGYALAVGGLLFSVTHLANPKNAIKSFSQWRSSWLSREGIAAIASLLIMAIFAIGRIFLGIDLGFVGLVAAVLCLVTILTTSMIYTQLRTVPLWHRPVTPVLFLLFGITGGAVLTGQGRVAAVLLLASVVIQLWGWRDGAGAFARAGSDTGTATGLGKRGHVRPFEPPHHGTNYLLKEMAYSVGRRHAARLRVLGAVLGFVLPAGLLLAVPGSMAVTVLAALSHLIGMLAVRWLFFAEARHVQSLYYAN